ncbi:ankyrin repeat-containing domain protein [Cladorrhinum samala]|uniref:Ankyrin repeat-containing domain protein n=1 Tax=Cladorrhinum samala TaxID=585594 RepID=A0AAV9HTV2_9PEZI|nr:ankyrin repeat-containing domain protein [Cladorrhinum samala]
MATDHQWESNKAEIRRLYLVEETPQKELLQAVRGLGLTVTKAQLEYRLKLWKFKRNIDKKNWPYIDNRINKRTQAGKASEVIYCGRRVKASTVNKETNRHRDITFSAQIAPPPSPQSPKDVQISICTPQPFPLEFVWPSSLPWLQFQSTYSHLFLSPHPQQNQNPGSASVEPHPDGVSKALISSIFGHQLVDQRPNLSKLASAIGISMPEAYPGENLTRGEMLLSGSGSELLRESMMIEIFRISNNLLGDGYDSGPDGDEIFHRIISTLHRSGITRSPLNLVSLANVTISAFIEKLFQWAFVKALESKPCELCEEKGKVQFFEEDLETHNEEECKSYRNLLGIIKWMLLSGQSSNDKFWDGNDILTPLQHSVTEGKKDLIELLLNAGADPNLNPGESGTPLELAIELARFSLSTSLEIVHRLLASNAKVTSQTICSAIKSGQLQLVQVLVKQQSKPDYTGCLGAAAGSTSGNLDMLYYTMELLQSQYTPADIVPMIEQEALVSAAKGGNNDAIEYLLEFVSCVSAPSYPGIPADALFPAAEKGHSATCELLIKYGAPVNAQDIYGITPLHKAAQHGDKATCELLIRHGARVNTFPAKPSPLHVASFKGNTAALDVLICNGALVNQSYSAITSIAAERYFGGYYLPEDVKSSLAGAGADLVGSELLVAAYNSDAELLHEALGAGADPNQKNNEGHNALRLSLLNFVKNSKEGPERLSMVTMLLNANILVQVADLIAAIRLGDVCVVQAVLAQAFSQGVWPINHTSASDMGPLEAAILAKKNQLLEMVMGWGGNAYEAGAVRAAIETDQGIGFVKSLFNNRPHSLPLAPREIEAVVAAIKHKDRAILGLLLSALPFPNQCQLPQQSLPLDEALELRDMELICQLLDHGYRPSWETLEKLAVTGDLALANILITERGCPFPPESLCSPKRGWPRHCPLTLAVINNHAEMLQLLLTTGLDVDDRIGFESGRTRRAAFQQAVENANLPIMDILLTAGADVNAPPALRFGATALQLAAIKGYLGIAKQLMELGADPNAHRAMEFGRTALEGAAEYGRIDMIDFLLKNGVKTTGSGRRQYLRAVLFAEDEGNYVAAENLRSFREWTEADKLMFEDIKEERDRVSLDNHTDYYSDEYSSDEADDDDYDDEEMD